MFHTMKDIVLMILTTTVYIASVAFFCETTILVLTLTVRDTETWKILLRTAGEYWVKQSKNIYNTYKSHEYASLAKYLYSWYLVTRLVVVLGIIVVSMAIAVMLYYQSAVDWAIFWSTR